jgi:two-component system, cell cycle response regulator DivK
MAEARKKLAVVEDNPDNRLLVRAIVDGRYDLVEYSAGRAALDGIKRDPPDLVLLDVSLPEMDGPDVLARLRADPSVPRMPVIALTAHAMQGDRERLLVAGFDEYVVKPIVDEDRLLATIDYWLQRSAAGRSSAPG